VQSKPVVAAVSQGVPGGVPGGQPGGVVGGVAGGGGDAPPPPPPPPEPKPTPEPTPKPEPPKKINVSGGVLQGSALKKVQPPYPPIAKAARASGAVQVQVTISEEGRVIAADVVSGHPLLRDAAVQAARQWVFKPTELSGVPVKVQGVLTFNFTLQ
jgi:protein TonB